MKIAIGADHRGFEFKNKIADFLKKEGHEVLDLGTHSMESCDYPLIGFNVAKSVAKAEADRGVLICMSGMGMSIVANKVPGVRAAICGTKVEAGLSREHNDANVIIISAKYVKDDPGEILKTWLKAEITEDRHKRRVGQITEIETRVAKGEA